MSKSGSEKAAAWNKLISCLICLTAIFVGLPLLFELVTLVISMYICCLPIFCYIWLQYSIADQSFYFLTLFFFYSFIVWFCFVFSFLVTLKWRCRDSLTCWRPTWRCCWRKFGRKWRPLWWKQSRQEKELPTSSTNNSASSSQMSRFHEAKTSVLGSHTCIGGK